MRTVLRSDGMVHRYRRLSAAERLLVRRTVLLLLFCSLGLRLLPYKKLRRALDLMSPHFRYTGVEVGRICRAVVKIAPAVPHCTCLVLALALHALLRGEGQTPWLRIGICRGKGNTDFEAHAWVELAGVAYLRGDVEPSSCPMVPAAAYVTQLRETGAFK